MSQVIYSLYDDNGYVQQDGYCDAIELVEMLAHQMGLRIYWGLTETKFIDRTTGEPAQRPVEE